MSADIQQLIKRYQAGEEVRGEIETALTAITDQVIIKVCGKQTPIYKPELGGWANLEPFMFNADDLERVIKKSLDEALRTYDQERGAMFSTWYHKKLYDDIKHLKNAYKHEQEQGKLITSMEVFNRESDNWGDLYNLAILKDCQFITAEELDMLSDKQIKYIVLSLTIYGNKKRITDNVAADVLGIERNTIQRYKKELRRTLASSNDRRELHKKRARADDIPALLNEYGAKDPTPREAAKEIYKKVKTDTRYRK